MTQSLMSTRARQARQLSDFYAGNTDIHPQGKSGMEYITAPEDDRRCMETSAGPSTFNFGEWHNIAGFDFYVDRSHEWVFRSRRGDKRARRAA